MIAVFKRVAACAAILAAVSACGPEQAQLSSRTQPPDASLPGAGALDGCSGVGPLLTKAACADEDVLAMNQTLSRALRTRSEGLSREGLSLMLDGQSQWFAALRVSCALDDGADKLSDETKTCVQFSLFDRLLSIASSVETVGPYIMQRVDTIAAFPAPESAGRAALMSYVSYPRIDAPNGDEAAFNAMARRSLRFGAGDLTEEIGMYRVAYAGADIVSVQFETYDMKLGAASPNRVMEALTVVLKQQRRLRADDVFKPGGGWEAFVARQAEEKLKAALDAGCDPPESAAKVRQASLRSDYWVVSDTALKVLYPPFALGPESASGCEIDIAWRDAKPYLNVSAPAPIGGPAAKREKLAG